ncbi:nuclear pore membrane glycoprotein 210 [Oncorhynchus mykiss]|uniref:nuclear pore membrane glycoprotein 210 n=1 Tax=Oncorhynchus mykiss TaxID=8022 RepID=UPI000B4FB5E4|nr:nuclear pore membrane glycoprotein 210 [Oncorhynchus mykiss]
MAVLNSKVLCKLLIFSVTIIALSQSTRLNVPKLLLPRSNHNHVNFTLTAEKGCYKWVSSQPQAVVVWPLSPSIPPSILHPSACSQHVLVSARPQSAPLDTNRGASIIRGQDSVTGHTLRCDVIVDQIKQIQVVTTTRQLFTEDPPLVLSVMALDSGGLCVSQRRATPRPITSCPWRKQVRKGTVCCWRGSVAGWYGSRPASRTQTTSG